eukprot:COSAG04_NODE_4181_length_2251_cov_22.131041_2_plen_186_part_00
MLGTARDEGGTFVGLPGNLTEQGWQVHTLTAAPGVPLSNLTELCKLRNEPCRSRALLSFALWTKDYRLCLCADTDHSPTKTHSKWWWAAAKLDGDISFHCTTRDGARLLTAAGSPTYLYSFEPAAGFPSEVIGHCSEKSFLLDSVWPAMPAPLIELGEAMGRSWVAFVSQPRVVLCSGSRPHRCI